MEKEFKSKYGNNYVDMVTNRTKAYFDGLEIAKNSDGDFCVKNNPSNKNFIVAWDNDKFFKKTFINNYGTSTFVVELSNKEKPLFIPKYKALNVVKSKNRHDITIALLISVKEDQVAELLELTKGGDDIFTIDQWKEHNDEILVECF